MPVTFKNLIHPTLYQHHWLWMTVQLTKVINIFWGKYQHVLQKPVEGEYRTGYTRLYHLVACSEIYPASVEGAVYPNPRSILGFFLQQNQLKYRSSEYQQASPKGSQCYSDRWCEMSIGTSRCLAKTEGLCWGQQTKCIDDGTDRRNGDNKLCSLNYIKLFLCQFSWCTLKLGSLPGHCNWAKSTPAYRFLGQNQHLVTGSWAKINTYLQVPGSKVTPTYRFLGQNQHLLTGSWLKIST